MLAFKLTAGDHDCLVSQLVIHGAPMHRSGFLFAAACCCLPTASIAEDSQSVGCIISYRSDFSTDAPCTLSHQGEMITVTGLLHRDGRGFIAVIDTAAHEAMLVADTGVTLAYGKFASDVQDRYVWDNGHRLIVNAQ